jgi:predicted HTH domain antitoxin
MVLEIPENIEKALGNTPAESKRRALESILLDAYRKHKISRHLLRETLGLSWFQVEDILARNGIMHEYSVADLEKDAETNKRFFLPK